MTVKKMWRFEDVKIWKLFPGKFAEHCQKGWQPATDIECNLVIAEVSPDDGAGI